MKYQLKNKSQQGFTLIELMIVIAILAILMAIAIPAYQDYISRSKASEGITMAAPAKLAVSETILTDGTLPANNAAAGYSFGGATTYVASIVTNGGVITVTTQNTGCPTDPVFVMTPNTTPSGGNAVEWACTASAGPECAPATCRN